MKFTIENTIFPEYGFSGGNPKRSIVDAVSKNIGDFSGDVFVHASNFTDGLCFYCGKQLFKFNKDVKCYESTDLNWDHIYPSANYNLLVKGNVAIACSCCNKDKSDKDPVDFYCEMEARGDVRLYPNLESFTSAIDKMSSSYMENYPSYYQFGQRMKNNEVSDDEEYLYYIHLASLAYLKRGDTPNWSKPKFHRHVSYPYFKKFISKIEKTAGASPMRELFSTISENPLPLSEMPVNEIKEKILNTIEKRSDSSQAIKANFNSHIITFLLELNSHELIESLYPVLPVYEFHNDYKMWSKIINENSNYLTLATGLRNFSKIMMESLTPINEFSDDMLVNLIEETILSANNSLSKPQFLITIFEGINRESIRFPLIKKLSDTSLGYILHPNKATFEKILKNSCSISQNQVSKFSSYLFTDFKLMSPSVVKAILKDFYIDENGVESPQKINMMKVVLDELELNVTQNLIEIIPDISNVFLNLHELINENEYDFYPYDLSSIKATKKQIVSTVARYVFLKTENNSLFEVTEYQKMEIFNLIGHLIGAKKFCDLLFERIEKERLC